MYGSFRKRRFESLAVRSCPKVRDRPRKKARNRTLKKLGMSTPTENLNKSRSCTAASEKEDLKVWRLGRVQRFEIGPGKRLEIDPEKTRNEHPSEFMYSISKERT